MLSTKQTNVPDDGAHYNDVTRITVCKVLADVICIQNKGLRKIGKYVTVGINQINKRNELRTDNCRLKVLRN